MSVITHLRASFADPGLIPEKIELPDYVDTAKLNSCEKCDMRWKPQRAHHCSTCQRCVFKVSKVNLRWLTFATDGPPLSLDQQLCGNSQLQILFPICILHLVRVNSLVPTDGPIFLLPFKLRKTSQAAHARSKLHLGVPLLNPRFYRRRHFHNLHLGTRRRADGVDRGQSNLHRWQTKALGQTTRLLQQPRVPNRQRQVVVVCPNPPLLANQLLREIVH